MKPKRLSLIGSCHLLHQHHGVACGFTERQIELVYSPLDDSEGSRFSPRWGRQLSRGAPTYDLAKFSQKLHDIERIWTLGGGRVSKILLCRSATGRGSFKFQTKIEVKVHSHRRWKQKWNFSLMLVVVVFFFFAFSPLSFDVNRPLVRFGSQCSHINYIASL